MANQEYKLNERVFELMKLLNVPNINEQATQTTEHLSVNKSVFNSAMVPMHNIKLKVADNSPNLKEFVKKYDELKEANVQDLDLVVYFLNEISDKPEIKKMLASTFKGPLSKSKLTDGEINKLKDKCGLTEKGLNSQNEKINLPATVLAKANDTKYKKRKEIPVFPNWDRPHLSWDFYPNTEKFEMEWGMGKHSLSMQEDMIIDDILNCMAGIEGKYIKTPALSDNNRVSERTFHIDRSLDPALRELTKRIMPICVNYSLIIRFIETKSDFTWGLVNHALCSAIRELLKNHYVFICQLENLHRNGELSMQKLWYYVSPIMGFMEVLASIIRVLNSCSGCGSLILDLLFDKILAYTGDPKLQELIIYLAQTASKPYLTMLEDWIYKGQINDPYDEFMIGEYYENNSTKASDLNAKSWDTKYRIDDKCTPKFLRVISEKILLTGKYLNAMQGAGKVVTTRASVSRNELHSKKDKIVKNYKSIDENDEYDEEHLNDNHDEDSSYNHYDNDYDADDLNYDTNSHETRKSNFLIVPNAKEILFTTKEEVYKQIVEKAYNYSSKVLLNLLLKDHKLIDRLRSLKHYFLLDQADFMVHFMDISEDEMKKNKDNINVGRLESLLELSLRITSANSDPYKDDLKVTLHEQDLKSTITAIQNVTSSQQTSTSTTSGTANSSGSTTTSTNNANSTNGSSNIIGLYSFSLNYVVNWPLSMVINDRTLLKYQILFRHIFLMKHVERQLCNVWLCTKSGEICLGRTYKYYSLACALKQRMLNFIQNLLNYMTFEVFESSWSTFEENIRNVTNIDDVIAQHDHFLDTCLRDCLITSVSFLNIQKIMSICTMFSEFVQAVTQSSKEKEENAKLDLKISFKSAQAKRKLALQEVSDDLNKLVCSDMFAKAIADFDRQFSQLLLDLLERIINEMSNGLGETKIGNVLYRLDFNDHYREQIEKLRQLKVKNAETSLNRV